MPLGSMGDVVSNSMPLAMGMAAGEEEEEEGGVDCGVGGTRSGGGSGGDDDDETRWAVRLRVVG